VLRDRFCDHFDEFEREYPERYQERCGYWRPVIRLSINKFLKCGDLKEWFAWMRCPDCHEEFFVAFSCRQRSCYHFKVPSNTTSADFFIQLRILGSI
jgi:hypothetical protein